MKRPASNRRLIPLALAAFLIATAAASAPIGEETGPPEARLLRFPDIHGDFVVFAYAGDIWRASATGGPAWRLTTHPGVELFPKISPDGRWIAFSAEYTGTRQVYVMPSWGGEPKQLTYYNDVGVLPPRGGWDYWVLGWTSDGTVLVRMNRVPWGNRMGRYFTVSPRGGLEQPLVLPEGGSACISPDGKRIAYTPIDREFRTWKREMGGRAQDIWIYDLEANRSERITDWRGTDNFPMWHGDTIYFTSDREHTLNIFAYDTRTHTTRKVTDLDEYDVLWPSLGPDAIVFMNGGFLYRLDLATRKTSRIPITLGSDAAVAVPYFKDVRSSISGASLSPGGARALFEARGELFTVPAKDGPTRNITQTQGVREMSASWSPDGKSVAYLSDATGEYEIYVRTQDGKGEPRRLTTDGAPWKFTPVWSLDSKKLAYGDRKQRLRIVDVASGEIVDADRGTQEDLENYSWSPDGKWLVYEKSHPTRLPGIAIYSVEAKKAFLLGDGLTADFGPTWSTDGKHLFFLSNRDFNLDFSSFEFNYVYTRATRVYAAAVDPSAPPLFPEKSDEEKGKADADEDKSKGKEKDAKAEGDKGKGDAKAKGDDKPKDKEKGEPVRVVPEGYTARTVALPGLRPGAYRALAATADAVFYLKGDEAETTLYRYDLKERKEEEVVKGAAAYDLSRDGKKLLYRARGDWFLTDARAGVKSGDGKLDLSDLRVKLDPRAEWAQMYDDAWRITRDWFYDENLHGVDWAKMRKRYGALVPFIGYRGDLDFLLGELLGELEAGHTYVASGDEPRTTRVTGGMLGCTFQADASGRYKIATIYAGENWEEDYRSPLTEPGVDVREGDFLVAVDGEALKTTDNPYRLLEGKAGKPVVLTVNSKPVSEGARDVTVRPIASELGLLYLDWVKSRMAMADKLSGGKVGYIHLPDTAQAGNRMLQKLFYSQASKPALIIDDRYNGGGFIPDRMVEYFSRHTLAYWARRGVESMRTPGFAHNGPKAMLINGYSSSGGDALPYFFRSLGLGKLIGTRTWGGLIGLSGNPSLVDGGAVQVPTFRIYDPAGKWVVENEGVSPDIEVTDLPEKRIAGGDPSLEKAVEVLLDELRKSPASPPERPAPPDMTRQGGSR